MWILLNLLLLNSLEVHAFPVFTFSDTFYPPAPPSFASLTRTVELPGTFILCSSSKQARFDDRAFYTVLGEDGSQWLTVLFEQPQDQLELWIIWNKSQYRMGNLTKPRVNYWYHICLQVEVEGNKITVSVNGEVVGTLVGEKITKPKNLCMVLGKSCNYNFVEEQFQGSMSNIQVFSTYINPNITALSSEPCGLKGGLLSCHPDNWRVEGERWVLVE